MISAFNSDLAGILTNVQVILASSNVTNSTQKGQCIIDDCGYTSMSGIITGMLSMGDSSQITSLLGNLGIDINKFMPELEKALSSLTGELGKILKTDLTSKFDFSKLYANNF